VQPLDDGDPGGVELAGRRGRVPARYPVRLTHQRHGDSCAQRGGFEQAEVGRLDVAACPMAYREDRLRRPARHLEQHLGVADRRRNPLPTRRQRDSAFAWQTMHRAASGRASSRPSGSGVPQITQRP